MVWHISGVLRSHRQQQRLAGSRAQRLKEAASNKDLCLTSCPAVYFFGEICTSELLFQFNHENRHSSMSFCMEVQYVSISICKDHLIFLLVLQHAEFLLQMTL